MKKILLLVAAALVCFSQINAQLCTPDPVFPDTLVPVNPPPYDTVTMTGGIPLPACIDEPYEMTFSFLVPDTLVVSGLTVAVSYLRLNTTGAITGMPFGLSYTCNPPNCTYYANTLGCSLITGTPTANNAAGDYPLVINAFAALPPPFGEFPITIGGPSSVFPGEYVLELRTQANCLVGSSDLATDFSVVVSPNPTDGQTIISVKAAQNMDNVQMTVTDLMGRNIETRSIALQGGTTNNIQFDGTKLPEGMYLCTLRQGSQTTVTKIVIAR